MKGNPYDCSRLRLHPDNKSKKAMQQDGLSAAARIEELEYRHKRDLAEYNRVTIENRQLREALDKISMIPNKGSDRATLEAAVAIARKALEGGDDG